jgi:deoxyadenosine/deoxycytidine kinase
MVDPSRIPPCYLAGQMSHVFVIEGLIGVGKTTLCRLLEREWGARIVLEPADDNPFLARFYSDPTNFAFPTQMFYLATRYAQQRGMRQGDMFSPLVVSDYLFAKDRIFAEMTLSGPELALYERFAGLLDDTPVHPDFVVFLDAETDVILRRIARRNISAEQVIPASYLDDLRSRYYSLWARYTGAPVYVLRTDTVDYVGDPAAKAHILAMLRGWMDGTPVAGAPEAYKPVGPGTLFGG